MLMLGGCSSQSAVFELLDQSAKSPASIHVVVTQRNSNQCWTNAGAVAKVAAANLSGAYDAVSISSFDEGISADKLVFQVFGWAFRRGGVCFGNFRISLGHGLEVKSNGFIDTVLPATTSKRKAILGSPAKLNESLMVFVDEISGGLAEHISETR